MRAQGWAYLTTSHRLWSDGGVNLKPICALDDALDDALYCTTGVLLKTEHLFLVAYERQMVAVHQDITLGTRSWLFKPLSCLLACTHRI